MVALRRWLLKCVNRIAIANVVFSIFLTYLLKRSFDLTNLASAAAFLIVFLSLSYLTRRDNKKPKRFWLAFAPLFFFVSYLVIWYERSFGGFDFGAIIFHLNAGYGDYVEINIIRRGIRYIIFAAILAAVWTYYVWHYKWFRSLDLLLCVGLIAISPASRMLIDYYDYRTQNLSILAHYSEPDIRRVPVDGSLKNLLVIYAESAERTFGQLADGNQIFAEMNEVASRGLEVVGVEQAVNTGWSVAGLVASQCGVPLQPSLNYFASHHISGTAFLPNVTCLGDVLRPLGYQLEYVSGSDLNFAGMNSFLLEHGYSAVVDGSVVKPSQPNYMNGWGAYDDTMLEFAEQRLKALVSQQTPFVLSIATIGGHAPNGYPTQKCREVLDGQGLSRIGFAIKCSGYHIKQSIEEWQKQGLLHNTAIVVMSDHLMMRNGVSDELRKLERLNYLAIIDDSIAPNTAFRQSATFDVYPTLLELLGFELHGHQAGIGRSLLASRPSLVEELGARRLNAALTHDRAFSAQLWGENQ